MSLTNKPYLNTHHCNCFLIMSASVIPRNQIWHKVTALTTISGNLFLTFCLTDEVSGELTDPVNFACNGRETSPALAWNRRGGANCSCSGTQRVTLARGCVYNQYKSILISSEHLLVVRVWSKGEKWPKWDRERSLLYARLCLCCSFVTHFIPFHKVGGYFAIE